MKTPVIVIEKLIDKVVIHSEKDIEKLQNNVADALVSVLKNANFPENSDIEKSLTEYETAIRKFTDAHKAKLEPGSTYCNKIGLERDLLILWESFRRLEDFIRACNIVPQGSKNYESYRIVDTGHSRFLPLSHKLKSCPGHR